MSLRNRPCLQAYGSENQTDFLGLSDPQPTNPWGVSTPTSGKKGHLLSPFTLRYMLNPLGRHTASSVRKEVRFQVPFSGPSLLAPLETGSELPQSTTFFFFFLNLSSPFSSVSLSLTYSSDAFLSPTTGIRRRGWGRRNRTRRKVRHPLP